MTTEKQVAANRVNSKRSTGPKTPAGRMASSRNAYRHGLSYPSPLVPGMIAMADAIGRALAGKQASEERITSAAEFARSELELLRIRSIRNELWAKVNLTYDATEELRRIAALDRYERYCLTNRRRASRSLDAAGKE
jgi:hypothetical protein